MSEAERRRAMLSLRALGHVVGKLFGVGDKGEEPADKLKNALIGLTDSSRPESEWDAILRDSDPWPVEGA